MAEKYDTMIKENGVYLFSNGTVKIANSKYSSIKNDYCVVFDRSSEIQEVEDDSKIKGKGFCFITLDQINEMEQQRSVDVIAVIT